MIGDLLDPTELKVYHDLAETEDKKRKEAKMMEEEQLKSKAIPEITYS